jgi:hypothetical protein
MDINQLLSLPVILNDSVKVECICKKLYNNKEKLWFGNRLDNIDKPPYNTQLKKSLL